MVGHQHIGVDGQPLLPSSLLQPAKIEAVILVCCENRFPVIAALDNVQRLTRQEKAGKTQRVLAESIEYWGQTR
jgi:hypothetical protein